MCSSVCRHMITSASMFVYFSLYRSLMNCIRDAAGEVLRRRLIARIDADAAVVAQLAHQREEFALAAADFDDRLVANVVAIDPALRQFGRKFGEGRRNMLRFLALRGIFLQLAS